MGAETDASHVEIDISKAMFADTRPSSPPRTYSTTRPMTPTTGNIALSRLVSDKSLLVADLRIFVRPADGYLLTVSEWVDCLPDVKAARAQTLANHREHPTTSSNPSEHLMALATLNRPPSSPFAPNKYPKTGHTTSSSHAVFSSSGSHNQQMLTSSLTSPPPTD